MQIEMLCKKGPVSNSSTSFYIIKLSASLAYSLLFGLNYSCLSCHYSFVACAICIWYDSLLFLLNVCETLASGLLYAVFTSDLFKKLIFLIICCLYVAVITLSGKVVSYIYIDQGNNVGKTVPLYTLSNMYMHKGSSK